MKTTSRTTAIATAHRPAATKVASAVSRVAVRAASLKDKDRFESNGGSALRQKVTGGQSAFAARFGAASMRLDKNAMLSENSQQKRTEQGLNAAAGAGAAVSGLASFTASNPANFTLLEVVPLIGAGEGIAVAAGFGAALAAGVGMGTALNMAFEAATGKTIGDAIYDATEGDDEEEETTTDEAEGANNAAAASSSPESTEESNNEDEESSSDESSTDSGSDDEDGQSTEASNADETGETTESEEDNDGDGESDADGSTPNPESDTSNGQTLHGATGGKMGDKPETKNRNGAVCPADESNESSTTGATVVGLNGRGGCEVLQADRAFLDARTALWLKIALTPGSIRA